MHDTTFSQPPTHAFGRRAFLGSSLALVAGLTAAPAALARRDHRELAGFLQLSRVVTGARKLPTELAPHYLRALDAANLKLPPSRFVHIAGYTDGDGPASLRALQQSRTYRLRGSRECVDAIAAAWWSGVVPTANGGQRVITFSDALVWRAMPYAYPPTQCLGATGAWSWPGRRI
jgi:D-sorbitol dehydrogenase-like protein